MSYEPLSELHAEARRRGLMVDVTYAPSSDLHWVLVYVAGLSSEPQLILSRDTAEDAITAATAELRETIGVTS